MRHLKQTLLLSLLPLLLFGIIWRVNWRREHPPATVTDEQVRAYLMAADRIKIEVEACVFYNSEIPEHERTFITNLSCDELRPIMSYLNVVPAPYNATASWPVLYFELYKGDKYLSSFGIDYGHSPPLAFVTSPPSDMDLHPTSARRLRQLVAQHPEIMRALLKAGVTPQELKSD